MMTTFHYPDAISGMLHTWDYLDYLVNVVDPRDQYTKKLWADGKSDEETDFQVAQFDERTDKDIGIFSSMFCSNVSLCIK